MGLGNCSVGIELCDTLMVNCSLPRLGLRLTNWKGYNTVSQRSQRAFYRLDLLRTLFGVESQSKWIIIFSNYSQPIHLSLFCIDALVHNISLFRNLEWLWLIWGPLVHLSSFEVAQPDTVILLWTSLVLKWIVGSRHHYIISLGRQPQILSFYSLSFSQTF